MSGSKNSAPCLHQLGEVFLISTAHSLTHPPFITNQLILSRGHTEPSLSSADHLSQPTRGPRTEARVCNYLRPPDGEIWGMGPELEPRLDRDVLSG